MMLGHNIPHPIVKGEYAKRVREAARRSTATREEMLAIDAERKKKHNKHTFEWV